MPSVLTISPDGLHVYVPASNDDALVVFSRNTTTGALSHVESLQDGVAGVDGLNGAHQAAVSPDGSHVYVAGYTDDAIAVFSRNSITGILTFVEVQLDGVGGVDGLNNARSVVVSPDGNHVYAASATDDAIAVFTRNTTTGALTYVENLKDGVGGVDGLNGAYTVIVSPDNAHVYAAAYNDDAVTVFTRNTTTGKLTYMELHQDDSQGGSVNSLNAARSVSISSDGLMVYAVSSSDDGLVAFTRNTATGRLSFDSEYLDGVGGVNGLDGTRYLAISPDDLYIYTVSTGDDAISSFVNAAILPIELISFEANSYENASVELIWTTATEKNNELFVIEHSTNGKDFNAIGERFGAGNSSRNIDYVYLDESPVDGYNYYRLKQVDQDGNFTYSKLALIQNETVETNPLAVSVYPNPCTSNCQIRLEGISTSMDAPLDIALYNTDGKQVLAFNPPAGSSNITLPSLDYLPKGMYILQVVASDEQSISKIMLQ